MSDKFDPAVATVIRAARRLFVRLPTAAALKTPAVASLIDAAVEQAKTPLPEAGRGSLVIKSVSARQRPRRTT